MGNQKEGCNREVHFTYKPKCDSSVLCQGDLLEITPTMKEIINEIHPYFTREQYKYFIILTQSCDLVRRDNQPCKSPYITLAAVRSFDDFFKKIMLERHYVSKENQLLLMKASERTRAVQFIERVYNNTEPEYFFLYKEELIGLPESMVAFLKVSIALKSSEHYDECLQAKKIELADEFKAKLGWMVGNIYSRVGTTDWDIIVNSDRKKRMLLSELEKRCLVVDDRKIKEFCKSLTEQDIDSIDDAKACLERICIETDFEKGVSIIEKVLDSRGNFSDRDKDIVIRELKSKETFRRLFKTS